MATGDNNKADPAKLDARVPLFQGLIRGMLPLYLLILLQGRPLHGTEIIRSFREMSNDRWKPSPGSVYPVLRQLEQQRLVSGRWRRSQAAPQRVYRLTAEGRRVLPEMRARLVEQLQAARALIDSHVEALRRPGGGLGGGGDAEA
jgi:DNA-binding PadR family transcriptional regulator